MRGVYKIRLRHVVSNNADLLEANASSDKIICLYTGAAPEVCL